MSMRDAVICEPVRTPIGGMFASLSVELGAAALKGLPERTGVAAQAVQGFVAVFERV